MVNNFILRTLSTIVLIPIVFLSISLGGLYFQSFSLLCLYLMLNEWFSMNKKTKTLLNIIFGIIIALFVASNLGYFSFSEIIQKIDSWTENLSPYLSNPDDLDPDLLRGITPSQALTAVTFISILAIGGFKKTVWSIIGIITTAFVIISGFVLYHAQTVKPWPKFTFTNFVLLALIVIVSGIFILRTKNKEKLIFPTGILYITIPMLFWMNFSTLDNAAVFRFHIISAFVIVWSCDIFAYLGGRLIGGPKLAPSISPKKTWSGAIVAFIMTLSLAAIFLIKMPKNIFDHQIKIPLMLLLLCAVMIIASILGDLLESKTKRILGVKDSGSLIPGHGGVCDRLDSFLMVSYVLIGIYLAIGLFGEISDLMSIEK